MTKKQKFQEVIHAMRYTGDGKENAERAEIYLIDDKLPKESEVRAILMRNIWDDRIGGAEDLSYEICARACDLIADMEKTDGDIEDMDGDSDDIFYESESASVYTDERLKYLNIWNQDEISQKQKEFDCDIQTACAVWYDDMVRSVALELRDYILKD